MFHLSSAWTLWPSVKQAFVTEDHTCVCEKLVHHWHYHFKIKYVTKDYRHYQHKYWAGSILGAL